jgi:hypothetical protein
MERACDRVRLQALELTVLNLGFYYQSAFALFSRIK